MDIKSFEYEATSPFDSATYARPEKKVIALRRANTTLRSIFQAARGAEACGAGRSQYGETATDAISASIELLICSNKLKETAGSKVRGRLLTTKDDLVK